MGLEPWDSFEKWKKKENTVIFTEINNHPVWALFYGTSKADFSFFRLASDTVSSVCQKKKKKMASLSDYQPE